MSIYSVMLSSDVSLLESMIPVELLKEDACKESVSMARSFLRISAQRITNFLDGKLECFDPLVSDQACQNRAITIAVTAKEILSDKEAVEKLKSLSKTLTYNSDLLQKKIVEINQKKVKLEGSLKEVVGSFDCQVPPDLIYLIKCALLTLTSQNHKQKVICECHKTQVETFREKTADAHVLNISGKCINQKQLNSLFDKVIRSAKQEVALLSCEYLKNNSNISLLSHSALLKTIKGRNELPCFLTLKGALNIAEKESLPLLIKIKKALHQVESLSDSFDLSLLYSIKDGKALPLSMKKVDESEPLFVIEGQRCGELIEDETLEEYTKRFLSADLIKTILMNASQHSQYSDKSVDNELFLEEDKEIKELVSTIEKLSKKAVKKGCSYEDQSLFRITHIFSTTLKSDKVAVKTMHKDE